MLMAIIESKKITKSYRSGTIETHVLKGVDFSVEKGEWVAIMGRSGAGKSTLLYQLSLLDEPTSGEVLVNGVQAERMSDIEKMRLRLFEFGFVFQDYALMPELTALENVVLPLLMENLSREVAEGKASEALSRVGLGHRLGNLPSQLSGGEQQRVSVARAIAERPQILFADEPTANLDRESSDRVIALFKELNAEGQTIIMVTHEEEYGRMADRIVRLDDGRVISS